MDIKILGPLEARENGVSITPTACKPRQLLALLALQTGHVVTVPMLIEELWGTKPPRSALTTLQTYVLQVRRLIGGALAPSGGGTAKDVLVTRYGGYMLDVAPECVDIHRYEQLAGAGQRAYDSGDLESASRLLHSALDVWRGPALVDVQTGGRLSMEVTRLQESRLGVLEVRIDADMGLGRYHSLLSELSMLNAQHPLNENLCAQYMIALYRSGRQCGALDAYRTQRDTMIGDLGLEPSMRLRQLHRAMLRSDPSLDENVPPPALERLLTAA
jgi:DNA-binding SARP family transcriptional activator